MKLQNVMLGSEKPKALAEFYAKLLGEPCWSDGEWTGFMVGAGLMIRPHSEVKGVNPSPARIMMGFETTDVKGEFERIKGIKATVVAKPYQPDAEKNAKKGWPHLPTRMVITFSFLLLGKLSAHKTVPQV